MPAQGVLEDQFLERNALASDGLGANLGGNTLSIDALEDQSPIDILEDQSLERNTLAQCFAQSSIAAPWSYQ